MKKICQNLVVEYEIEKCQRHFGVEKLGEGLVRSSVFNFKGKYHVAVRYWRQEVEGSSGLEEQESE